MNVNVPHQAPKWGQPDARPQVAALCWRVDKAGTQVLLITSRDTGRWVIPKGWPMEGLSAWAAAAREAWEEAGVMGHVADRMLGEFHYEKVTRPITSILCAVTVYPLRVESVNDRFPEAKERRRAWYAPQEAASLVAEPGLQGLLRRVGDRPQLLQGAKPA